MLNYIIEFENRQSIIYTTNNTITYDKYKRILTTICDRYCVNLDTYNKSIRKNLGFKNNIPIFFNDTLLIIRVTLNGNIYYINYMAIACASFNGDNLMIIFKNGQHIILNISIDVMNKNIRKCKEIVKYIKNDIFS